MDYTKEQAMAIRVRGENLMISAGAGAGKTRVLISRMAEMMLSDNPPVDADAMLVMTFTKAAAAEMKERISKELSDRLEADPDNPLLLRQNRLIRHAEIGTIHGFCSRLIRSHYQEIGLDPSFRVGDQGEMVLLQKEAMEELLEESYGQGGEAFLMLSEACAPGRDDRQLEEIILDLYHFTRAFPDPEDWLNRTGMMRMDDSGEGKDLKEYLAILLKDVREELGQKKEEAETLLEEGLRAGDITDFSLRLLNRIIDAADELLNTSDYDSFQKRIRETAFPPKTGVRAKDKAWTEYPRLEQLHESLKKKWEGWKNNVFILTEDQIRKENQALMPFREELVRLCKRFEEIFSAKKAEKNICDYDDLEHYALAILIEGWDEKGQPLPSPAARELSEKYQAYFVDEYQDVSLIQETILNLLCASGGNHIFTVGDVKQSIYRFRQARPDLFLARSDRYTDAGEYERNPDKEREGVEILLRENFRSSPAVIDTVNFFFRQLMERDFGGVDYDDSTALIAGRQEEEREKNNPSEMLLFLEDEEYLADQEAPSAFEAETAMIGKRIRKLLEEGYRYGDIVILLRSAKNRHEKMAQQLEGMGIPVISGANTGYFDSREISVIMNYLAVVDNVYQDIPMASVMLSGIGGFAEEDLMRLSVLVDPSSRQEFTLYDLMGLYLEKGEDPGLLEKTASFLSLLEYFREKKKELPLATLLWEIYRKTGFYYEVQLLPDGESRKQNLLMLLKKAEDYEDTAFKGLFYFNRYMEQMKSYEIEMGGSDSAEDHKDAVKIMTIHKSKGLEFPVVFVSGLSKKFNLTDTTNEAVFHPELGIGMEYRDLEKRIHHPSFSKKLIQDRIKRDSLEEELRILYVAMTRAREKLILTQSLREKKLSEIHSGRLSISARLGASSCSDWLMPALLSEPSPLSVSYVRWNQIRDCFEETEEEPGEMTASRFLEEYGDREGAGELAKIFSWQYPWRIETTWKRKYSVSELKHARSSSDYSEEAGTGNLFSMPEMEKEEVPKPAFLSDERSDKPDPAERGTIVHKLMECIPFGRIVTEDQLEEELERQIGICPGLDRLDQSELEKAFEGARAFLFSPQGEMLRESDREGLLFKETPFTIGSPAELVYPDSQSEEMVVIQGIIDLYCETEDGLWLLDYKTDRIRPGQEDLLLDRYTGQMLYYKTALERITGKPVIRMDIFSFALKKFLPVEGNH